MYTYDGVGNITRKDIYPYTRGNIESEPTQSIEYTYADSEWKDLLTAYDGNTIEYDAIGNPTSYLGNTLEWQGRQLSSFSNDKSNISYTYDSNGLRVSKTVDGVKTYYEYNGDKLQYQETGSQKLYFWYDVFGNLSKVYCDYGNGSVGSYIAVCNSRGDVDTLYTVTGEVKAKYTYDSWGNTISVTDANGNKVTSKNHIGNLNPIRYRGYYYDTETGFYYLQSRYYNPTVGRFLNADVYCDTESSILGTNMFAYCGNNPIIRSDSEGQFWDYVLDIGFVAWSVADVVNDPSDWKNWAALLVDVLFAVIPFVPSGVGQVIKVGNRIDDAVDIVKSINKIDDIIDISKLTLIGRNMQRVTDTANLIGKANNLYKVWKGYDKVSSISKHLANALSAVHNGGWLFNKLRQGYSVIDLGLSTSHSAKGLWYGTERFVLGAWQTRNIWKMPINYFF